MFSFYLSPSDYKESKLIFGQYDISKFAKPGLTEFDIVWSPVNETVGKGYWNNNINKADFWDRTIFKGHHVFIPDSGSSYAFIPSKCLYNIVTILNNEGFKCSFVQISLGFYFCYNGKKTYHDLPDLKINI